MNKKELPEDNPNHSRCRKNQQTQYQNIHEYSAQNDFPTTKVIVSN